MDETEKTLCQVQAQQQAILDGCEDIIILFDDELRVVWSNNSMEKLCSAPVGKKCHEIFCGDTERCNSCVVVNSCHESESENEDDEKSVITKALNSDLIFRVTSTPVRETSGKAENVIVIARDITERLQLEKQLRHAAKMEAVGTLAGGIAHDFNNVLTPIMGYSEIIRLNLSNDKMDRHDITGFVDEILKASKRAKKLVEQILSFSRSIDHHESRQYVHPILKEAMKLIHVTLPSTIEIIQEIDENCGMVSVDPVEIHQIIINLCTNAADAMAGKSGILKVGLRPSDTHSEGREWLEMSVTDNGCGMEAKAQERIFEPYFTTKEKEQGTGMGLALVHGIVERQGGRIAIDSSVGEGTSITLYLPVVRESSNVDSILRHDFPEGKGEHILLVDDEQQVVAAAAEMLRGLGYLVTEMTSSKQCLAAFQKDSKIFDAVITDLTMPHMTGIELCAKMKAIRPDIPVVLFTGFLEDFSRASAIQSGVDGFCMKPISLKHMAKTLSTLFTRG